MRCTCFKALALIFVASVTTAGDAITIRSQRDLSAGAHKGQSTISLKTQKVVTGEPFELEVRFWSGGGVYFYNPFFNSLIPPPARLAIFGADKVYIGDMLHRDGGSRRLPAPPDWTIIPGNCYVGTTLKMQAGHVPGTQYAYRGNELPAGKYYLQMIYHGRFASAPPVTDAGPDITPENLAKWKQLFTEGDLFRSNIVELELVEQ
jgi:hypothetical protein